MKKSAVVMAVVLGFLGKGTASAEGPFSRGLFISKETFRLIQHLAKAKEVVADIETQNRWIADAGKVREIQDEWIQSTDQSDLVQSYRQKPSCQAMRDAFSKEISLVDCFTLDAQGRVV